MNKKKILVLAMTLSIVAILAMGATLAYFTDSDSAKNVMALGNVTIEQNEYKFEDGERVAYTNEGVKLMPRVDAIENGTFVTTNEKGVKVYNPGVKNVVDKFITVENTGDYDAYVRTIVAFETDYVYEEDKETYYKSGDAHEEYIGILTTGLDYVAGDGLKDRRYVTIDDELYVVAVKVYDAAIPAQTESEEYSLHQLFLSPDAGNEVVDLFGDEYTIYAVSQAVQTEGFTKGAADALNTAFGNLETVSDEELIAWLTK